MNRIKLFGRWWVGCAALFMLLTVWTVQAQSVLEPDSVGLEFADSSVRVGKGQTFIVNVVSHMETPVYGFGFQVQFDPTQLKVFARPGQDGAESPLVVGDLFGDNPQRVKNALEAAPDPTLSQVDVVYTLLPPEPAVRGSGIIGSIAFTMIGDGASEIRLVNPRLIQISSGQAQDVAVQIGTSKLILDAGSSTALVGQPQAVNEPVTTSNVRQSIIIVLVIATLVVMLLMVVIVRKLMRSRS